MEIAAYRNRIACLRRKLAGGKETLDGIWIRQPENRRYLSGFKAEDANLTESSGSLVITENRLILITDSRFTEEARKETVDFEVHTQRGAFAEEFSSLLQSAGVNRLGFEEDSITWGLHRQLSETLNRSAPPIELVPVQSWLEEMREVKDEGEVKALEGAASMTSEILEEVVHTLKAGQTEKQVAWRIENLGREAGADGLSFPCIVASGPHAALPHAVPTDRELGTEEPIILDIGFRLNGYCADMTRTVFLGPPQPEFRRIYGIVRQAQLAALKEVREGVESTYPDSIARQTIGEHGFEEYFGHSLGHGVGLATHENPRLSPRDPVRLKKGMVVTVEPGIYIPGKGGVRLEEMVVIEDNGPRVLTESHCFYDYKP
jgi:Xaa-Pro aminopeptidase